MAGKYRSVKLRSVADVNNFMAKIINMVNRDEMDPNKAAKLGYLCNSLISGLKNHDFDIRITKLEKEVTKNGKY
ncbi:MAG TPA: hypothetical protein VGD14_25125 [bacterium]